jgi:hypothetical protein
VQYRLTEMATTTLSKGLADGHLAATGGESLSLVWWVGAGLVVVGAAIGVLAYFKRRKGAGGSMTSDSSEEGNE